jgi:lipid-binding SYLF domain-containing protein
MSNTSRSSRTILHGILAFALAGATLAAAACSTAPKSEAERAGLQVDTTAFIAEARETDPTLERFFDNCAGYAVFPSIGKGGFIVGGAYGRGQLFDREGRLLGYCDVSQGSIGAQIGGQSFGEIIFFESMRKLQSFKGGEFALAAQASAVALASGAAAAARYDDGVAIFVLQPKGLMVEASIGGQQFNYQASADVID